MNKLLSYLWIISKGYGNPVHIHCKCILSHSDGEPDYSNHIEYISRQLNTYLHVLYRTMIDEKEFDNATVPFHQTIVFHKYGAGYENGGFNIPFDFSSMTICASTEEHRRKIIALLQPQEFNIEQYAVLSRDGSDELFVFPFSKFNIVVDPNYFGERVHFHDNESSGVEECKATGGKAPRFHYSNNDD